MKNKLEREEVELVYSTDKMKKTWSLDELYTSFESEAFLDDFKTMSKQIAELTIWTEIEFQSANNSKQKMIYYIEHITTIKTLVTKLIGYANLTLATDVTHAIAITHLGHIRAVLSELAKPEVLFLKWLKEIDNLEEIIASDVLLTEHNFYLKECFEETQFMLSEDEEVLIAKMQNTGSKAWSDLQDVVSSTLLVDIEQDGKTEQLPIAAVRNMAYSKDAATRKSGYEAELAAYPKIEASSAAALNGIKGEVITVGKMRGYSSPLEETIRMSRMDKETLDVMLEAMKESLPAFQSYFKAKAKMLGHQNALPFYDLFAPVGIADMQFSYEEAEEIIVKNFKTFSPRLAEMTTTAFADRWIDAMPKKGKVGGAFCSNIHPIKQSRILANFDGSFGNVKTLAHELGHAYHGLCLQEESILNSRYTMPIAETASIFCETILKQAAIKEADEDTKITILEADIQGAAQVIVDIYSRYLFETSLFEKRADHCLSVEELKEAMLDAQRQAYGEGLDSELLHPYMWLNKPHYYSAGLSFYNFPYAFGLLFAKGVYAEYLAQGPTFATKYDQLLQATGKNKLVDVAKMIDVDLHDINFWRKSLAVITADIAEFIKLSEKK